MSLAVIAAVNFVLASLVVAAILKLHIWAILSAHQDHVPVVEVSALTAVEPEELILTDLAVEPALG